MKITIQTPAHTLFQGEIYDVTLPTHIGEITILPGHAPLTTIIEAGVIKCTPTDQSLATDQTFVFDNKKISIAIGNGIAYIDGQTISVLATAGATQSDESLEDLQIQKQDIESQIETYKKQGLTQKVEQLTNQRDAITANIKLSQITK